MDDVLPSELRVILRITLDTKSNDISTLNKERRQAPFVRELVEAILFSRRFLPTYLVAVVGSVLLWALARWFIVAASNIKRRRHGSDESPASSTASSSSSTLQGTTSPLWKNNGISESTPLLLEADVHRDEERPLYLRVWHRIRSFLLRQPKPIPSLTAPKNTLPANETTIVILLFLVLNLFYLFYRMPLEIRHAFTFADRAGLLFVVNLPVLYILAAKNNQPLGWITGWSYEGLNIFHRRLGEWMTFAAILHAIGMVIGFYQLLAPSGYTLGWYLTRFIIVFGVVAFVSYMLIYFTSIGHFRQAYYELFLALHILLQVGALVMLYFHHHDARPYVGAAIAVWILDRGVTRIACKTKPFIATLEVAKDKETVLLYCDVPLRKKRSFGMHSGWQAGQHVFLTVPDMGALHRFQAHPFTIASPAPPQETRATSWPLQLTIRAQDGFSRELLEYAKLHQHTRVLMDGPYSSCEVLHAVCKADRLCIIAGGSGIAVTYPFAWARIVRSPHSRDILQDRAVYIDGLKRLPYVARMPGLLDTPDFAHFWVRQDPRHESWVTMLPAAPGSESEEEDGLERPKVVNVGSALDLITHRFDTRSATGEHQRPNIQAELQSWVKGSIKQEIAISDRVCVVVSGPDGLVRDVQNGVSDLVRDGWNIEVHVEKFGW